MARNFHKNGQMKVHKKTKRNEHHFGESKREKRATAATAMRWKFLRAHFDDRAAVTLSCFAKCYTIGSHGPLRFILFETWANDVEKNQNSRTKKNCNRTKKPSTVNWLRDAWLHWNFRKFSKHHTHKHNVNYSTYANAEHEIVYNHFSLYFTRSLSHSLFRQIVGIAFFPFICWAKCLPRCHRQYHRGSNTTTLLAYSACSWFSTLHALSITLIS